VANTVPEMQEAIDLFGREVIPNFQVRRWTRTDASA